MSRTSHWDVPRTSLNLIYAYLNYRLFSSTLPSLVVWNTDRGKNNSPKPSLNTETNTNKNWDGFRWSLRGHSVTLTSKLSMLLFTCFSGHKWPSKLSLFPWFDATMITCCRSGRDSTPYPGCPCYVKAFRYVGRERWNGVKFLIEGKKNAKMESGLKPVTFRPEPSPLPHSAFMTIDSHGPVQCTFC